MKKRRWYRKKRMWVLFLFLIFIFSIRMEWAKFRYDPEKLKADILENTQVEAVIHQKDFKGKTIQYIQVGKNSKAPIIVFVHGSPGSLADYKRYLSDEQLSKETTMISIDRLGFGYSDFGNVESDLSVQARSIAGILKPFQKNKIILVGYSLGGPVAAKTMMDFPDLADALVLIAPSISPELEPSNGWRKIANWKIFQWLTPPALRVCNQEIIPLKSELEKSVKGWENIKIPVTVIQGTKDKLVPKENANFAEKMLVNSFSVDINIVENTNHFILWSKQDLIKEKLLDLLKKIE